MCHLYVFMYYSQPMVLMTEATPGGKYFSLVTCNRRTLAGFTISTPGRGLWLVLRFEGDFFYTAACLMAHPYILLGHFHFLSPDLFEIVL